jgi:hypothetical protein
VPVNPLLKAREVVYYMGDSDARLLFVWHGLADQSGRDSAVLGRPFAPWCSRL